MQFAYNRAVHLTTKFCPFEIVYVGAEEVLIDSTNIEMDDNGDNIGATNIEMDDNGDSF